METGQTLLNSHWMEDDQCIDPARAQQLLDVRQLCIPEIVLLMQRVLFRSRQWREWYVLNSIMWKTLTEFICIVSVNMANYAARYIKFFGKVHSEILLDSVTESWCEMLKEGQEI